MVTKWLNKILLTLFLKPGFIYTRFRVDLLQLKALLSTRLEIDDRQPLPVFQSNKWSSQAKGFDFGGFKLVMAMIFGLTLLAPLIIEDNLTRMSLYYSGIMTITALFLIMDFSSVLFNKKDDLIIASKPISSPTYALYKLLHISIHVSKLLIPISLPAVAALAYSRGYWGLLVFIIVFCGIGLFTILAVVSLYLMVFRWISPGKIDSVISLVQVTLSILFLISFRMAFSLIEMDNLNQIRIDNQALVWALPSFWFAGLWTLLYQLDPTPKLWICAILVSLSLTVGLWLVNRFFTPALFRSLSTGSGDLSQPVQLEKKQTAPSRITFSYSSILARILTTRGPERSAFYFCWKMTNRDREFKLRILPELAYSLVTVFFMFRFEWSRLDFKQVLSGTADMRISVITVIYLGAFTYPLIAMYLQFSRQFKASWFWYVVPLKHPGMAISGTMKASIAKFALPLGFFGIGIGLAAMSIHILPNLILAISNVCLLNAITYRVITDALPFSKHSLNIPDDAFIFFFLFMSLSIVVAVGQYFLFQYTMVIALMAILSITALIYLIRNTKQLSWEQLKAMDSESLSEGIQ